MEGQSDSRGTSIPLKKMTTEEASKYPIIADLNELYLDENKTNELIVVINGKRIPITYRELYWEQYNDVVEKAMEDTAEYPDKYERLKQKRLMKLMVKSVAGVPVDAKHEFWAKLTQDNGEILRKAFFENTGEFRVSEVMIKKLREGLNEETRSSEDGDSL